ncbi:MAG TPA: SpoIIE family protein phosphatase [Candidatus Sulfotelmatobacter sp.]|jgi:PAS domain S-box-containing protein|nr:SpoIIE family protein phosphatase [Candidatus Sulfotelmatobacter sp.]
MPHSGNTLRLHEEAPGSPPLDFRDFAENAVIGIFRTTLDGRYLFANQALAHLYGFPDVPAMIGQLTDIEDQLYVDPTRRDTFRSLMSENDVVRHFQSEIRRADGATIWISETARAVRNAAGQILYYEGTVTDATADRRISESLRYANMIQNALLPDRQTLGDAVSDIQIHWEPLQAVSGDYYWMERQQRQSLIFLADCTGHGVPGAFMTLITASAIDTAVHYQGLFAPADILSEVDHAVRLRMRQDRPDSRSDDGLDAAILRWDEGRRIMTFCGASIPLLYAKNGNIHEIKGNRANLGYRTNPPRGPFAQHDIPVEPGMVFYLFSDGVSDHVGGTPRRLLGRKRLKAILSDIQTWPLNRQIGHLKSVLKDYRGTEPRRDDMTMILIQPL